MVVASIPGRGAFPSAPNVILKTLSAAFLVVGEMVGFVLLVRLATSSLTGGTVGFE